MDILELKKEQYKLAEKIVIQDTFNKIKTIGGIDCLAFQNKIIAGVVVCEFPSMKIIEFKTAEIPDPLPYIPNYQAYREMPAMIEAFNQLDVEPDILLVDGCGILHPRKCGMASHLGLALNKSTIGVSQKLTVGRKENSKIYLGYDLVGFEVVTKEHANPLYVSPGHLVSLGTALKTIQQSILPPHKLPEPIHLANKMIKKEIKKSAGQIASLSIN